MQLPQPYLHTSDRMIALVDRPQMAPAEGPIADPVYGFHTLWAAEVPFIPTHLGIDDADFDLKASNRISQALQRQIRFLYDLAQYRDHLSTFELRLVCWPQPSGLAQVGIAFLGKTFHTDREISRQLALRLWDKFSAVFPSEAPFSYPLVPVLESPDRPGGQTHSFTQWHTPIPLEQLNTSPCIVELRKYEDWPNMGGIPHVRDYIPHPFKPALDYSAMARLFETMARQKQVCIVAITLRPQQLTDQEDAILHDFAGWFRRTAEGKVTLDNPVVDVLRRVKGDNIFLAQMQYRAEMGCKVYEDLLHEHHNLFLVRLQVVGTPAARDDLVEALGSEVMANAETKYPSRWTRVEARDAKELRWARFNLEWLEFVRWGISPRIQQVLRLVRLRQLATVAEAAGAFRLPVAPHSGGIAGVEVRDEPFALPSALLMGQGENAGIPFGMILDRGISTATPITLPLSALTELSHIWGDAGESREAVLHTLLGAAAQVGIPWILIRGTGISSTALTRQLGIRRVSLDPISDSSTLGIHPFLPPPGISLTVFIDALLRVFMSAYTLDTAAGIVLRRALLQTYEDAGWTEQGTGQTINLAELATQVERAAQQEDIPVEIATAVRTRCVLPLRDLAATAAKIFTAPSLEPDEWLKPTVVEIGWIGSDASSAIVRGCLWVWFALAFTAAPVSSHTRRRFAILEDAHTIFAAPPAALSAPLTSIGVLAQTLARVGVGTLLLDDRPDLLDGGLTSGSGITILTRMVNEVALAKATALIGASPRQKTRIRHLGSREAVVVLPGQAPVLVTLPGTALVAIAPQ